MVLDNSVLSTYSNSGLAPYRDYRDFPPSFPLGPPPLPSLNGTLYWYHLIESPRAPWQAFSLLWGLSDYYHIWTYVL
jgi:hypothetical protein